MIDVTQYIHEDLIISDLKALNKNEAISELIDCLYRVNPSAFGSVIKKNALSAIMEREAVESTGVGEGMAFPHGRIKGWRKSSVVIGISSQGIDFAGADGKLVHFVGLIVSSLEEPYIILQIMAAIIRFFKETSGVDAFWKGLTAREIYEKFSANKIDATKIILAKDIMRTAKIVVQMDTTVEEAVRLMHLNQLDALPIVGNDNYYEGMITCFDIFNYGIPNFFHQLQTVSFVRHIDPFEKYFNMKLNLVIRDIFVQADSTVHQDSTLLEVIFQLCVKNKIKLFVLNNGRLAGEIDRFSLIDKILFF